MFSGIVQMVMILPYFLSWVIVGYCVYGFLATDHGQINTILKILGHPAVHWYQSPQYWRVILILVGIWKTCGYSLLIYLSRATQQGAMTAICDACDEDHARAALRYLELLNTDRKFRDILAYGIEGKHFEYLENGTVLRTQEGRDRFLPSLYPLGSVVNASVESVSRDFLSDPDQWEKVYQGYREYGIFSKTRGFVYDTTRKEDLIAVITAIYQNYAKDLRTGTSDPDVVVPKMRAEMEKAGVQELIDDIQSQLDEYLAQMERLDAAQQPAQAPLQK